MLNKRYEWTKNFTNGDRYHGEAIENNKKDGRGEYFWAASGATYTGMWSNDAPHGEGTMTVPGEQGYVYEGLFDKGVRCGAGKCRFHQGRQYTGEWRNDQMDGTGVLTGSPGVDNFTEYRGPFSTGVRSGPNGICTYTNGDVYEGCWANGKRNGRGEMRFDATKAATSGNAPRFYKGNFVDDKSSDKHAELQYADGSSYHGGVEDLERCGDGELRLANGDVHNGRFLKNVRDGRGVLKCADGRCFTGTWRRDQLEGQITFTHKSAGKSTSPATDKQPAAIVSYTGPCSLGEFTGSGAEMTLTDGSTYAGDVRQGIPSGKGRLEQFHMKSMLPAEHFGPEVVLTSYVGGFVSGRPEGDGTGTLHIPEPSSTQSLPSGSHGFRISYRRNGVFEGKWSKGLPYGKGTWRWDSGDVLAGEVVQGLATGYGTYRGTQEEYQGHFERGQPHGRGVYHNTFTRRSYEGDWKEGLFDGKGEYVDEEGQRAYSGHWKAGQFHGDQCVERKLPSRSVIYEGHCARGQRHGQGVLHDDSGMSYEGGFVRGVIEGKGRRTDPDGTVIDGTFEEGQVHGPAKVKFTAQEIAFSGTYAHGKVEGEGEIRYPNGDVYVGEVEPANAEGILPQRHGKGRFMFVEGNRLECTWRHNVLHGEGTYTAATGEVSARSYVDGVVSTKLTGGAGGSNNMFAPENEFPNTLSEDALREKMRQNNKPHKFVRRGERSASIGDGPVAAAAAATEEKRGAKGSTNAVASKSAPPASRVPPSTVETQQRKANTSPNGGNVAPVSRGGRSTKPQRDESPSAKTAAEKCPTRVATVTTSERRKSVPPSSASGSHRGINVSNSLPAISSSHGTRGSNEGSETMSPVERFQRGVEALRTVTPVMTPRPETEQTVPKRPLKGNLKKMMDDACAIRNSKEDEIHLLTEEVRSLNEKIWQLRFAMSDSKVNTKDETQLKTMMGDRRAAVEKLQCLLDDD